MICTPGTSTLVPNFLGTEEEGVGCLEAAGPPLGLASSRGVPTGETGRGEKRLGRRASQKVNTQIVLKDIHTTSNSSLAFSHKQCGTK